MSIAEKNTTRQRRTTGDIRPDDFQQASLYTRAANRGRLSDEGLGLSESAMIGALTVPLLEKARDAWDGLEKNTNDFNGDNK